MKQTSSEKYEDHKRYLQEKVQAHVKPLMVDILKARPDDVLKFMAEWCQVRHAQQNSARKPLTEKDACPNVQTAVKREPEKPREDAAVSNLKERAEKDPLTPPSSDDERNSQNVEDAPKDAAWFEQRKSQKKKKVAISAEVCNIDAIKDFKPRVIAKTDEQVKSIRDILQRNFMFNGLDERNQQIVIDAMEIKDYQLNDMVIRQGDDGNELFIVESGLLRCTQKRKGSDSEVFLRNYEAGGLFGELALMYNVPRAASITAVETSRLFALDRLTFNNIVKISAIRQREKYEAFLEKIDILKNLDSQEKAKICDCLMTERFAKNALIIKERDAGDKFYLIQEGTAEAFKTDAQGNEAKVFDYKENDYFGELALLSGNTRKASIRVTSDVLVAASLDKESFKRLLGPIENILERNKDRYQQNSSHPAN